MKPLAIGIFVALLLGNILLQAAAFSPAELEFFEARVRPVLADRCYKCHSESAEKLKGGLRLDSREGVLKGGDSGPAILPKQPAKSLLIKAISHADKDLKMPPKQKLRPDQIDDLAKWIAMGAPDPREGAGGPKPSGSLITTNHWAFQPVRAVTPPPSNEPNPIDRFINQKLDQVGLGKSEPASRRQLLRRVKFDLLGLPPEREEIAAFENDSSPQADENLIERYLASPQYGERWGRYWLDLARYSDTAGDNADYPIPEVIRYRDYIIDAFNSDKPYNQFIKEQIAGDIIAKAKPDETFADKVSATGFVALSRRYGTMPRELWHLTIEDAIDTTGRVFLGLTLRCARCHDHKFDPITKEDYYALYGIFNSVDYPYAGSEEYKSKNLNRMRFVPLLAPEQAAPKLAAWQQNIQELKKQLKEDEHPLGGELEQLKSKVAELTKMAGTNASSQAKEELNAAIKKREELSKQLQEELKPVREKLAQLEKPGLPPDVPGAYAVQDSTEAGDAHLHIRGEPGQPGPMIPRDVPAVLRGDFKFQGPPKQSGRLQLAEWISSPSNPLTARVMANRIWQHHFGKGIAGTPSNFGIRGEPPTHPELLDYLASHFAQTWSVKEMHRLILTSDAYQRSSEATSDMVSKDPGNAWYARFDRRRLDAEAIRDATLAVPGSLNLNRPGEHPFGPVSSWGYTQHQPFKAEYLSSHRTVYLMTQRIQRHSFLGLFDGPDTNTSTDTRTDSTVPMQALFLMNNPFIHEQSRSFARRILDSGREENGQIAFAIETAWGRKPGTVDLQKGKAHLAASRTVLRAVEIAPNSINDEAWASYARVLLTANEFFYID